MENSLDWTFQPKKVEYVFHKEFERMCPFYMSIGMSYEEFWYGKTELTQYYLKAFRIKEKREAEKTKWTIWEQGMYIYGALCYVSPIIRAFSKAKEPLPYPEKPWGIERFEQEETKEKIKSQYQKEREKVEIIRTQIYFENWAKKVQEKFEKKGDKTDG